MQVSVSKREAEMKMDNNDFDERTHNYRRKKWIEDGMDPDEMENKYIMTVYCFVKFIYKKNNHFSIDGKKRKNKRKKYIWLHEKQPMKNV